MEMEQVYDALRKAHAAGDTASAKKLADFIKSQVPAAPEPTLRQKMISSVPGRVLQGVRDPIDAGAQLIPRGLQFLSSAGGLAPNRVSEFFGSEAQRVDKGISEAEREYEAARMATGQEGTDWARLGGNVASPANLAIAARMPMLTTTMGRVGGGAVMGAVGGGLQPVNTERTGGDFASVKAGQMALGTATGAVATPIMGAVGDFVGRKLAGLADKGASTITLRQTTEEFAKSSGLDWDSMGPSQRDQLFEAVKRSAQEYAGKDPRVATRIADFKQLDMPYTLGQITRDPLQFATEKNLQQVPGVGDPLRERFLSQGAMLQNRIGNFAAGADEAQNAGQQLIARLRAIDDDMAGGVRQAYQAARQLAGKDAEVPLQGLAQDFAEVIDNFGDKVPSGVRNNFAKFGLGADAQGSTQRKIFTVEEADKLLKVINANQSNDPATNAALSALRGAVKRAVTQDAGTEDVFAPARRLAAQRFSLMDAVPALDAAASGAANPDTFVQNFIVSKTATTPQVKQLAQLLRQNDPKAFSQARAQLGAYLQRRAFGENLAGDKGISPERFASALREIGSEKLGAFFSPDEVAQLQRISRVAGYMESVPYASRPNTSGNWGAISSLADSIPGIPMTAAMVNALRNSAANQLSVSQALAANPARQLTPEQIRLASQILSGGSLAAGATAAQPLQ